MVQLHHRADHAHRNLARGWARGVCAGALALAASVPAQAGPAPWTAPWEVTFNHTALPLGPVPAVFGGATPMWHCGDENVQTCEADTGPLRAAFRFRFEWEDVERPYVFGNIQLRADDHYALYVNRQLVGANWLETLGTEGYDHWDLDAYLRPGAANEILVFACDGRPTDNPGLSPPPVLGSSLASGWGGCLQPSDRFNRYLLVSGVVSQSAFSGMGPDARYSLRGGEQFGSPSWEVTTVPAPGTLPLLLGLLPGALLARRRARRAAP